MSEITTYASDETPLVTTYVSTTEVVVTPVYEGNAEIVVTPVIVGPPGPAGEEGQWVSMTQAQFDALSPKDPETLYVIIG